MDSSKEKTGDAYASPAERVETLKQVFESKGLVPDGYFEAFRERAEEEWSDRNGARVVARAWLEPDFKARLLNDGLAAVRELGYEFPPHQRSLVVLENTDGIHNVIVCTLCSCTAIKLIGIAPSWYKDLEYRARVVKEARTVLREMGLELDPDIDLRVWDTTADTRYMVLPARPAFTEGWDEDRLVDLVTKESLIGVERL